jgi:hypothetical protein
MVLSKPITYKDRISQHTYLRRREHRGVREQHHKLERKSGEARKLKAILQHAKQ